jgi:outer membrane protein assembly factor BamD (BamD/ComL family)
MRTDIGNFQMTSENLGQTPDPGPVGKELFQAALKQYRAKNYIQAIILWERVRNLPKVTDVVKRSCLFNIGQANLKLKRPATSILYFERYLASTGLTDDERKEATSKMNEAKRRISIPV